MLFCIPIIIIFIIFILSLVYCNYYVCNYYTICALEVNKLLLLLLLYLSDRPGESIPRKKNIVGYSQVRFYKLRAVTRAVIVRVGVK